MTATERSMESTALAAPDGIARTYAEIAQRYAKLLEEFIQRKAAQGVAAPPDDMGLTQAFMDTIANMLANPCQLAQSQIHLAESYFSLWQNMMLRTMGMHPPAVAAVQKGDYRFKDAQWEEDFLFDFIKQSYLLTARSIYEAVAAVDGLDAAEKKRVEFFTHQFVDALSPSNFALTNPAVVRETMKSHGQNLLHGLNNLLRDLEAGNGQLRIKMTDTNAFVLGKNIAVTPGKVVFQNEMMQLIQFNPATKQQYQRPLLVIPPWINKYYILDLQPTNSFIQWATAQGHTVFVISWVNPDERMAEKHFEDYLSEGALAAIDAITRQTGEQEIHAVGYCLGGTLLAATLSYMAAKKDTRIAAATFFVTLLDFSIPGDLGVFIDEKQIAGIEHKMAERGYLEGSEMATAFNMLRANELIWSFVVNNYLLGKESLPFDLLYWNSDSTRMPYKMHSYYLRNMYLRNLLKEPGGLTLLDTPIDLSKIKTPSYFISAIDDHIAPWKGVYLGARLFSGPVRFVLGGSGHIAGIINPPAANKYGYWTQEGKAHSLPSSADDWFAAAEKHEGSWWTDWQAWITTRNAGKVPARDPTKGPLKVLEDAPGSYVKQRL
ncbi:MAG: class I poly(R)-hydroxyalkanoic acid synthase [Rugosibacter sp.]